MAVSGETTKLVRLGKFNIKTSILEFFEFISNYNTQLRKHFRGYKEIISYSNKFFYQEKLQVMKIRGKAIDEVLKFYNSNLVWSPYINPLMHHIGTHGIRLTPPQLADLKAFLLALTDSSFVVNPAFSLPARFPDGK